MRSYASVGQQPVHSRSCLDLCFIEYGKNKACRPIIASFNAYQESSNCLCLKSAIRNTANHQLIALSRMAYIGPERVKTLINNGMITSQHLVGDSQLSSFSYSALFQHGLNAAKGRA